MVESRVMYSYLREDLPEISHGQGIYLFDRMGRRYLDGCSGAVIANIGHGVDSVAEAMAHQARAVAYVFRQQFHNGPADRLSARLADMAPPGLERCIFVNSGSEAVETAVKLAVQYWRERGQPTRTQILTRWTSYHGSTVGDLSWGGHVPRRQEFGPLLHHKPDLEPPYCYRCPYEKTFPECGLLCARRLEATIRRIGPQHVAALIAEPVIGASAAAVVPPPGYMETLAEICRRYDVLFIADEVMTGMGRTGTNFAVDHWGVTPDMIVCGKGLNSGYIPLAAVLVHERIYSAIRDGSGAFTTGHTHSAVPVACAAGNAVLDYVEAHSLVARARESGVYLAHRLGELAAHCPIIGDVRGLGLMHGLELVADRETRTPFPPTARMTARLVHAARERGLLVYPASGFVDGCAGDGIMVAPPLTITRAELDDLVAMLDAALGDVTPVSGQAAT